MSDIEMISHTIALSMGAAWASGINLYAVLLVLGLGGLTGSITLPQGLEIIQNPLVISAAALMYFVEFFADKIPGVDTGWDSLHTFIRIPAAVILASSAVADSSAALELAAGIIGGGLAATSHATKAGTRLMINTSPEPFSNWGASLSEDILVFIGLWSALNHPILFVLCLILFILFAIWFLPKLWQATRALLNNISNFFSEPAQNTPSQ